MQRGGLAAGPAVLAVTALLCTVASTEDTCPGESDTRRAGSALIRSGSWQPAHASQACAQPSVKTPLLLGMVHFKCRFPEEDGGQVQPRGDGPNPWPALSAGDPAEESSSGAQGPCAGAAITGSMCRGVIQGPRAGQAITGSWGPHTWRRRTVRLWGRGVPLCL